MCKKCQHIEKWDNKLQLRQFPCLFLLLLSNKCTASSACTRSSCFLSSISVLCPGFSPDSASFSHWFAILMCASVHLLLCFFLKSYPARVLTLTQTYPHSSWLWHSIVFPIKFRYAHTCNEAKSSHLQRKKNNHYLREKQKHDRKSDLEKVFFFVTFLDLPPTEMLFQPFKK